MKRIYDQRVVPGDRPSFSWRLRGNSGQKSYQIKINDAGSHFSWESLVVTSIERHNIKLVTLPKGGHYSWSVTVTFNNGKTETANGQSFFTSIPKWEAKWLTPIRTRKPLTDKKMAWEVAAAQSDPLERLDPPFYVRKEFVINAQPQSAFAYVSARGIYGLWVNGQFVSDLFAPGYTSYPKRIEYQVYDLTKILKPGKNVVGMVVGDGWYTGKIEFIGVGQQYGTENSLIFQLNADDSVIASDTSFKWTVGPQKYADLYVGEYYDQANELTGWLEPGYDDSNWSPLSEASYSTDTLSLQTIPAVQETRTIQPTVMRTPKGELVLDAGENIVGYTSFTLSVEKDIEIGLEHSETIDKDGNFLQNILGQNKQQKDRFVAGSSGQYSWAPKLTFHGFRYVRVTGTDDTDPAHYLIHVIETPQQSTGNLTTSDQRINQLQANIKRSQAGNMICIPTDCPQRERAGWTGDIQVYSPTATYEADVEQFLNHWLEDMENEQLPDGQVPQVVPCAPSHDYMRPDGITETDTAGWSDAAVILPWRLYETYGDKTLLKRFYPMVLKYMHSVEKIVRQLPDNIEDLDARSKDNNHYLWNTGFQFGDWLMPGYPGTKSADATGKEVATLLYILTTDLTAKIAGVLEKSEDQLYYQKLNQRIKEAFSETYLQSDGKMTADYQGVYVLALATSAVPTNMRSLVLEHLQTLITQNHDRLQTGFLSVAYLLPVLHDNHALETANRILFQDQCPSWLYEVRLGATTMWEAWDAYDEDGTPNEYSMNHFAFGCVGEYLFRTVLGIDKLEPGFKRVLIKPEFNTGLTRASGHFDSIWGRITVNWELTGDTASLKVTLPPDVSAVIDVNGTKYQDISGEASLQTKLS